MKYTAKLAAYYQNLWNGLEVTSARRAEAEKYAGKILANKARYKKIEQATGVPWHFVALAHYRESTLNFQKNLCNGQPLDMRTTIVPKGRGPYKDFEESAYDALVRIKGYSAKLDWSLGPYAHRIEGYNGYGYHYQGIPSPYLVGGSNKQERGKYVADGKYDGSHWDTQLGVLTLLKALMEKDPTIRFGSVSVPPKTRPQPDPTPPDIEPVDPPAPKRGWFRSWGSKIKAGLAAIGFTGIGVFTDWQIAAVAAGFVLVIIIGGVVLFFWIWDAKDLKAWVERQFR
jgi:lysozyme family protein